MLDLLNKYYEYFLKLNLDDKNNLNEEEKFENFHKIIINEYDLSNDSELRKDINQFFNFLMVWIFYIDIVVDSIVLQN